MEPFGTTLAVFSLCVTLLNLIISTVGTVDEKKNEWIECETRLSSYRCQIATCNELVKSWNKVWIDCMREDDDYAHFWGPEGLSQVREHIRVIENQSKEIRKRLPARKGLQARDPTFLQKIGFVLAQSASLKDRISRMKEMVTDLNNYSLTRLGRMHDLPGGVQDTGAALDELLHLNEWREDFSKWMRQLHEEQRSRIVPWSLVLELPSDSDGIVRDETDLTVKFLKFLNEEAGEGRISARIVKLRYRRGHTKSSTPMSFSQAIGHNSTSVPVLKHPFSLSSPPENSQKPVEYERAKAALEVATWAFPLARSGWTTNLCPCIIHLVCGNTSKISALGSAGPRTCQEHQTRHRLQDRDFFFLGTTLAELILVDLLFINASTIMEGSKLEALRKIKRKSTLYMEAVRYCFQLDQDTLENFNWAMDTNRFMTRVVKPLVAS